MKANAILQDIGRQLPQKAVTRVMIDDGETFETITRQAGFDWKCLHRMDDRLKDNQTGQWWLNQNGYQDWLKDADQEERTRMMGALQLIVDLASDLAEDDDEDD